MILYLPIEPRGIAQQKGECIMKSKFGKPWIMHYEKKTIKDARMAYEMELSKHVSDIDYRLCDEKGNRVPLSVSISFCYARPMSVKIESKQKVTRPDVDNVAKLFLDCLTSTHMISDDSQITKLTLMKEYRDFPHIELSITEIKE